MTDTTTDLAHLDPAALAAHPSNVRRNLGDLRSLIRSVQAVGILEPLVVVPTDDGGHHIIAGHRRCAAAIVAGLDSVPCVVRPDLSGADASQIAGMIVENTERESLSVGELAGGYEQLAALGLSDTAIAKTTGATRSHVAKARKVAASEVATAVADRYDLTLAQALVLAEFDDDRDAVKSLAVCAKEDPGRFEHLASRLRQDRERREQYEATVARLTETGVRILDTEPAYGHTDLTKVLRLDALCHDGKDLTAKNHTRCPGHAAYICSWRPDRPEYVCTNPKINGHTSRYTQSSADNASDDGRSDDEAKAERKQVIENNKAWRAAEPVRRQYIRDLLARRTVPKGTLRYVTEEILAEPERVGDGKDELLADLLNVKKPDGWGRTVGAAHVAKLPDARLPLALLAQIAADREQTIGVHTWRNRNTLAARWFAFLASTGYTLSDIEQHVVDQTADASAGKDDPGGDEEPNRPNHSAQSPATDKKGNGPL